MASDNRGLFLGTTQTKDTRDLLNNMLIALNNKDSGYYTRTEFVNGQTYFPDPALTSDTAQQPVPRQVYRIVVNMGTLPAIAKTHSIAHGITVTATHSFTRIYGTATHVSTKFIPLPYATGTALEVIELWADATNVNIKVLQDMSAYTKVYVVLEYITT